MRELLPAKSHPLPTESAMIGGMAADPARGCLWLGMAGSRDLVYRFDVETGAFTAEDLGGLLDGYSYVHRSVLVREDRVYVGGTWVLGVGGGKAAPGAFSPARFATVLKAMGIFGSLLSRYRVIEREGDGAWREVRKGPYMSMDLASDGKSLWRLSPRGVNRLEYAEEVLWIPSRGGFVHALVEGGEGRFLMSDPEGRVEVVRRVGDHEDVHVLGTLLDEDLMQKATPGIDGLVRVGDRYLVGGTRNHARPFLVDLDEMKLASFKPCATRPRASALAAAGEDVAYLAAGVGRVGLYLIRAAPGAEGEIESLGRIQGPDGVDCHHLHDIVVWPDGRIFGGEFYPLDVPDPPWPDRPCRLWEIPAPYCPESSLS